MWTPINRDWTVKPPLGTPLRTDGHWSVQGLVGCWLFNEGAGNKIINLVDTVQSVFGGNFPPTWDKDGSINFHGTDEGGTSYIDVRTGRPYIAHLFRTTTLARVRNIYDLSGDGESIYVERASSGNDIYKLQMGGYSDYGKGPNLHFIWRNDAGDLTACIGDYIADNTWHDIGLILDGTAINLYNGGKLCKTGSRVVGNFTDAVSCRISGDIADTYYANSNGSLDYLYLYNRALSPNEIASLSANPYQVCQP